MASLDVRLADLITALGTDYKTIKTWIFGSTSGSLSDLVTTDKSSIVAAINETRGLSSGSPPDATESVKGIAKVASQTDVDAGADDTRFVTSLKLATRLESLTFGDATESVKGIGQIATQTEVNTGTNDAKWVTPLKFATRLVAYAQPLSANLTTLAGVASGAFGRTLLTATDASAARSSLGLAAVATSGSASDITTGTLPTAVLPSLAVNDFFDVANQSAMLALDAQKGDIAARADQGGKMYWLSSNSPSTLADWKLITAAGDVVSVAGKTGTVTLTKGDVGLGNVDNTSDADKPVSTAQATADNLRLLKSSNLSDVANAATALSNLGGQPASSIGNADADLVALYTSAKA